MVFDSKVAGKVTLKVEDIRTLSTEKPVRVVMKGEEGDPEKDWKGQISRSIAFGQAKSGFVSSSLDPKTPLDLSAIAKINPTPPAKPQWKGQVSTGATVVRGNTHSESLALALDLSKRWKYHRLAFNGAYNFAQQRDLDTDEDNKTVDNWNVKGQYDYFFNKTSYIYANLKYEEDDIVDLDYRVNPGAGYGYQWIEKPDMNFRTELGYSSILERWENGDEDNYSAVRFSYHVDKTFRKNLKFYHNLEAIPSLEDVSVFLIDADVGLQATLTARWSLDAKITFDYNSEPADDKDELDTQYILGLTWKF